MKIKAFFTIKKIIWMVIVVVLLLGGWFIFGNRSNTSNIQTIFVKQQDIEKTVLVTGQVVSSTDLNLSWQSSGIVKRILVKEGDVVSAGQLLAEQDTSNLVTQLRNAEAGLVLAEQRASASKNNLTNVIAEQNILVSNAHRNLLNSTFAAETVGDYSAFDAPTISGTYTCDKEGTYVLETYSSLGGISVNYSGLEQGTMLLTDIPRPMGICGLSLSFDKTKVLEPKVKFKIDIPNKNASNYNLNNNAYNLALQIRDTAIEGAKANVGTDSLVALAQIAQAQASVDAININIQNAKLLAPSSGTITQIDIKVGELAQATKEVIKLLNIGELHAEALVSEADITSIVPGQSIDNTFDAFSSNKHFTTTVLTVNPASTIVSGVVNYKVTGSLEKISGIKPGMTDNMTIKVAERKNVLVVPSSAIINKEGKHIVRVINDPKKKTYIEVEVGTGLEADGGLTEITSGLSLGQEIVTYIK